MLKNVGRKVTLIVLLLAVSLSLLTLQDEPFNLGLDLQGGTRLVYSVDFEQAYADGRLDRSENEDQVLNQIIQIIRNRVDPDGLLEPIIRRGGANRIIIELPGTLGLPSVEASSTLGVPISERTQDELNVADATAFPETGVVRIGEESIRYDGKRQNTLLIAARAIGGSPLQSHAVGDAVVLEKDDAFRAAIESLGELSFQMLADAGHVPPDTDLQTERQKLDDWAAANPGSPLSAFNRLALENGGPHPAIEWYGWKPQDDAQEAQSEVERAQPVFRPESPADEFRGGDLLRVYPSQDQLGFPAVGFEMKPARRSEFGDFTGENEGRRMAIVLNGEIATAPEIGERMSQGGIIYGRFSNQEMADLITVLRSGSLKIKPKLENDERVGATLGDDYVRRGEYSGLIAILAVIGFVAVYYRRLGVFATISLALAMLMLLGGLSFLNATLTLPGIAGIILTIGMAVDANILIFDRIREEMDKGRNVKQASKEGFERAMPAILDANITTFLTALILYRVGTGPVRGFAVTLMCGIVVSVFAALVITRVLVHFALEKGTRAFPMGQWMVKAGYSFLDKAKVALAGSVVLIVAGLALFAATPASQKLGIDFVGGAEARLRVAEPQTIDTVRDAIAAIGGPIGQSADVKAVLSSEQESGTYTDFRTTFKTGGGADATDGADTRQAIRNGLKGLLLDEPVEVVVTDGEGTSSVDLTLLFQEGHPTADIAERLADAGLQDAQVTAGAAESLHGHRHHGLRPRAERDRRQGPGGVPGPKRFGRRRLQAGGRHADLQRGRPAGRRRAPRQGAPRDGGEPVRHRALHPRALRRVQLRLRGRGGHPARRLDHARGADPGEPARLPQRRDEPADGRRLPDHLRLLAQRHDRHLRPRAGEPAAHEEAAEGRPRPLHQPDPVADGPDVVHDVPRPGHPVRLQLRDRQRPGELLLRDDDRSPHGHLLHDLRGQPDPPLAGEEERPRRREGHADQGRARQGGVLRQRRHGRREGLARRAAVGERRAGGLASTWRSVYGPPNTPWRPSARCGTRPSATGCWTTRDGPR